MRVCSVSGCPTIYDKQKAAAALHTARPHALTAAPHQPTPRPTPRPSHTTGRQAHTAGRPPRGEGPAVFPGIDRR